MSYEDSVVSSSCLNLLDPRFLSASCGQCLCPYFDHMTKI